MPGQAVELHHGFLVLAPVTEGVDRAIVEIHRVKNDALLDHPVGLDLVHQRGEHLSNHHRRRRLRRHDHRPLPRDLRHPRIVGQFGIVGQTRRQIGRRLPGDGVEGHVATELLAAGFEHFQRYLLVHHRLGLAQDGDIANLGRQQDGVFTLALIGENRLAGHMPERLQPALAVDQLELVFLGLGQEPGNLGHCPERVHPLCSGPSFRMIHRELVVQDKHAFFGEMHVHGHIHVWPRPLRARKAQCEGKSASGRASTANLSYS